MKRITLGLKRNMFLLALAVLVIGISSACEEEDDRDYALDVFVTVRDTVLTQNALVHIYAPVDESTVDYYLYTDEDGKVSIQLKNKAVVEIVASRSPYKACTFAELNRGVTRVDLDMKLFSAVDNGCRENQ